MEERLRSVRGAVRGRVQGVFYRASLAREARTRAVAGWVRNLPDGRVEFQLQGRKAAVDALLAWALEGPRGAQVDGIETWELETSPHLEGFSIRP